MTTGAPAADTPQADAPGATAARAADWITLTKPRLNLLVLITTLAGLYLAQPAGVSTSLLVHTLVGSALVAGGAAALNQVLERTTDALMRRTRNRPLAAGRLGTMEGSALGTALAMAGLIELAVFTNLTAAAVAGVPCGPSTSNRNGFFEGIDHEGVQLEDDRRLTFHSNLAEPSEIIMDAREIRPAESEAPAWTDDTLGETHEIYLERLHQLAQ